MLLEDDHINRAEFDERTGGVWEREQLELFGCGGCDAVYVGVPGGHDLLVDGDSPSQARNYNRPQEPSARSATP